jgi:hypothetical protein
MDSSFYTVGTWINDLVFIPLSQQLLPIRQETAPTGVAIGQGWIKPSTGQEFIWDGDSWELATDLTSANSPAVTGAVTIPIDANYQGTTTTALPQTKRLIAKLGATDVSTTTSFVLGALPGGIAATINNTPGSGDRGVLSLTTADSGGSIPVDVTFSNGFTTRVNFTVIRTVAPPPANGGPGSTSATTSEIGSPASQTHAIIGGPLIVRSSASGTTHYSANIAYDHLSGGGTARMAIKFGYRVNGSGSAYTDAAAEDIGTFATFDTPGNVIDSGTKTGLTANTDYQWVLYGRNTGTNTSFVGQGTFSVNQ